MSIGSVGGFYGLSGSGMDIDSLVKQLMAGQQAKSDALFKKKTVAEWQKTAYNTVYDDISKFRDTMLDYQLDRTLSPNKVSSSNTSVATVTVNADAADVNHSLVVAQLASGVNLTSAGPITPDGANKDTIVNQFYGGVAPAGMYKFTITNGEKSAEISIDPAGSINDLVSQINKAGVNLKASYDSTLDRFFIATNNTGSSAGIKITEDVENNAAWGNFFVEKLDLAPEIADTTGKQGKNAEFMLDGVRLSQTSNTFSISGVTYSLIGESPNIGTGTIDERLAAGQATNISVANDTEAAVTNVQALVDSYNKIMQSLNSKLKETRYKDFSPLTDAQRAEMKESEITAWESKAKSGMLHNDQTLTSLSYNMRNAFYNPISNIPSSYDSSTGKTVTYDSASSIGITTGADYREGGKLYLDTDKLRKALDANPDVLSQLFGAPGTTKADGTIDSNTQGIAVKLYNGIKTAMDQLDQIAGKTSNSQYDTESNYAKKIIEYNKQIISEARRFDSMQTSYYKQFNAMEVALQQLSAQSGWLSSFGTSS